MGKWCLPPSLSQKSRPNPAGFGPEERAMRQFNIHEAKSHFSKLVNAAAAGEEIVIAKAGKPIARLGSFGPAIPTEEERPARRAYQDRPRIRSAPLRRSHCLV